jgi:DNA-binding response OmpR family regulator
MMAGLTNVVTIEQAARHLLIVSQDQDLTRHIDGSLQKEGYLSTVLNNPQDALLKAIDQGGVDAILWDGTLDLPQGRRGLFQYMRGDLERLKVPLMVLLDPKIQSHWRLAHKLRADEFLLKTAPEDELLLRLRGLFWRREHRALLSEASTLPENLKRFVQYVKTDLEANAEKQGVGTIALIEVVGARALMAEGNGEGCDGMTGALYEFLTANLRRADRLARYNQSTLVVYMPQRTGELAQRSLDVLQTEFLAKSERPFCAGLVTYPEDGTTVTELLMWADRALADARANGGFSIRDRLKDALVTSKLQRTIMLVDDDPAIVALLKASFNALGYQTVAASNGKKALKLIEQAPPDLVILDHVMPELSGFELLEELRERHGGQLPVPVVMLTIMNSGSDVLRGFELGVQDYIAKPFSPRELMVRVERVLKASQPLAWLDLETQ